MSLIKDILDEQQEQKINEVYRERDLILATLVHIACDQGYEVGLSQHDPKDANWEDAWRNIVFINLPTGQASWHIHDSELEYFRNIRLYTKAWDGHTTEEKYERLKKFCRNQIHIDYVATAL